MKVEWRWGYDGGRAMFEVRWVYQWWRLIDTDWVLEIGGIDDWMVREVGGGDSV